MESQNPEDEKIVKTHEELATEKIVNPFVEPYLPWNQTGEDIQVERSQPTSPPPPTSEALVRMNEMQIKDLEFSTNTHNALSRFLEIKKLPANVGSILELTLGELAKGRNIGSSRFAEILNTFISKRILSPMIFEELGLTAEQIWRLTSNKYHALQMRKLKEWAVIEEALSPADRSMAAAELEGLILKMLERLGFYPSEISDIRAGFAQFHVRMQRS